MSHYPTIIAIQAPAGADFRPVLPYLERCGIVEVRSGSILYLADRGTGVDRRLQKRIALIQATVQSILNVRVRIGAASSKTVSLVAARQAIPGGITIVPSGTEQQFLDQVVIDLLPGIGRRTATYLRNRGVQTIGKFGRLPQTAAVQLFGLSGVLLREYSRGQDPREVMSRRRTPPVLGRRSLFSLFATPTATAEH